MASCGRKRDPIWNYFEELPKVLGKTGVRARCIYCHNETQGLVARLKKHHDKCPKKAITAATCGTESEECLNQEDNAADEPSTSTASKLLPTPSKRLKMMDDFVVRTSVNEKDNLDEQLARFIFSANCPFKLVENKEFKKFCTSLRPGYKPPCRTEVADKWLPQIYDNEIVKCKAELENETVCMAMDGWSNIRNEPIVCVSVIKQCGKVILVDTIDTSGSSHTGNYLANLVFNSIKSTEENFKCKVSSFVTDNTANMVSARGILHGDGELGFKGLTYGCSAHILNLLAKDLVKTDITKHITNILKYFRNHHLPKAWYHAEGGSALVLPLEVRWNTYCDSLESYIKNWSVLTKVCEDHRSEIDKDIANKVLNIALKRNVEDMIGNLKPVAEAIDVVQKNNCSLAECVFAWKKLELKLASNNRNILSLYKARYEQVITDAHFAAFILSPSILVFNCNQEKEDEKIDLTKEEKKKGLEFIKENCGSGFLAMTLKFLGKLEPFDNHEKNVYFDPIVVKTMSDYEWWNSFCKFLRDDIINENEMKFIHMLTTAKASTASVERIFSTFGVVHSKLRNRLGVQKASKLVFVMKQMNSSA